MYNNEQQILYRAATRSFHSTRILRHLFTVHNALAEFELATKALDTYVEIVDRGKTRVEKSGEPEIGLDDDSTVLLTAAAGIHMLCAHGGRREAEKAQEIAALVEKWLEKHRNDRAHQPSESADDVPNDLVERPNKTSAPATGKSLAAAYRAISLSRVKWSRLAYMPSERTGLLDQAVSKLRTASQENLGETSIVETFYDQALALAEKRDINAAVDTVKRAISANIADNDDSSDDETIDEDETPSTNMSPSKRRLLFKSWHLLSLLLTAKQKFDAAVKSCEAAVELYGGRSALFEDEQRSDLIKRLGVLERRDIAELIITQLTLVEVMEGPEEAVNASGDLLGLYGKLFQYTQAPVTNI